MRSKIATALAVFAAASGPLQAAPSCVARQSVADMVVVLLPGIMDRVIDRCAANLPATAFLRQPSARQMRDRVLADQGSRTSSAAAGFREMAGGELPKDLSDSTVVSLMTESMPAQLIGDKDLDAGKCADIDRMLSAMGSMTPDQMGTFFAAFLSLSKAHEPAICPS